MIAKNQLKCGIIYKTIVMQAGDDEQTINYEWPYMVLKISYYMDHKTFSVYFCKLNSVSQRILSEEYFTTYTTTE